MTTNDFIKKLQSISEDKRKLPLKITCPNGLEVDPQIKMGTDDETIFGNVIKMYITY
jgi:hypothetical protein